MSEGLLEDLEAALRSVGSNSQMPMPLAPCCGSTDRWLLTTVQWLGATTESWKVAFWSGCSKLAYIRRASAVTRSTASRLSTVSPCLRDR